jgi:hypothetical protein
MGNKIICFCDRDLERTPKEGNFILTETEGNVNKYQKKVIKIQKEVKKYLSVRKLVLQKQKEFENYISKIGSYVGDNELKYKKRAYVTNLKPMKTVTRADTFSKDAISLNNEDGNIYQGNWSCDYKPRGYGCIYTSHGVKIEANWDDNEITGRIYYPFGPVFEGTIIKRNNSYFPDEGRLYYSDEIYVPCKFKSCSLNNTYYYSISSILNINNLRSHLIVYEDYSIYEGHINASNQRNGHGKLNYINGEIYEGEWHNNTYNGYGILFKPNQDYQLLDDIVVKEIEHKLGFSYLGYGTYIKGFWNSGHLNGKGLMFIGSEMITCTWRHGKVIESKSHKIEKSYDLHSNIYTFFNYEELARIAGIKNKTIYDYLDNNKLKNIVIHKFFRENKFISDNFDNITNLFDFALGDKFKFIPMFGYYTNGGYFMKKFHYNNMFNPVLTEFHYTNFVQNKVSNVIVKAVLLNTNICIEGGKQSNINSLHNFRRQMFNLVNHKPHEIETNTSTEILTSKSQKYSNQYILNDYQMDFHRTEILDKNIIDKVDRNKKTLFSMNCLFVDNSYKLDTLKYLTNPVKTLAIYIHNRPDDEIGHAAELTDDESILNRNINDLKKHFSDKYKIINTVEKNDYSFMEFNSQDQLGCKLAALVILNTNCRHMIQLMPNYHIGKYVTVKLINQTCLKGFKKTSIDIGTLNFFGTFLNLNN